MRIPPVLAFSFAAILLNCATLTPLPTDTCGNGVVDADEDCDSFPSTCGRPGDGARACRYTCDRKKPDSCLVGWGCSVEGFCRQETGEFDKAGVPSSAGVVTLMTGDFDGDGRTDIVGGGTKGGLAKPRVHFYDSNGVPSAPVQLQFPVSTPVVRDFDGDGRDDLAFAVGGNQYGSVALLSGSADRAFAPVLFPTVLKNATAARFIALPADPAAGMLLPLNQAGAVTIERDGTGTWFRTISSANVIGLPELDQRAPIGPEQVVGGPVRGHLFSANAVDPPSGCGEVVFPYNAGDEGHLAIITPCARIAKAGKADEIQWMARPVRDVVVCSPRGAGPCAPAKITGRTLVVDRGDGALVYVHTGTEQRPVTLVAESDGVTLSKFKELKSEVPLAVASLDAAGGTGIVIPTGVFLAQVSADGGAPPADAAIVPQPVVTPSAGVWSDARIGRFNGDDLPDVVAMTQGALELNVYANAGGGRFTQFSVSSTDPVRAIATGDFDGDRIEDVAFLASARPLGDTEGGAEVEILIAYGQATGGPEPARLVGRFAHATGLTAVHESDRSIDNILVVETTPSATTGGLPATAMTLLVNSGDRQTLAPLVLSDAAAKAAAQHDEIRVWQPASLTAAPLITPGSIDVMALAVGITLKADRTSEDKNPYAGSFPFGAWLAQGNKTVVGGLSGLREVFRFDPTFLAPAPPGEGQATFETAFIAASADIDSPPDGISEIVSLSRAGGRDAGAASDLSVVRAADVLAGKAPTSVSISDFLVSSNDELALLDVSNDGLPDAVVLTRPLRLGENKNRERLRVYLNNGAGAFSATPIFVDLPKKGFDGESTSPVGFARVLTGVLPDGRRRAELAVVTKSRLVLASLDTAKSKFELRELTDLLGTPLSGRMTAVAAGDYDGDGVQDLAVADSGSIRILRQQPRLK